MGRPEGGYKRDDGTKVRSVTTIIDNRKQAEGLIHWAWKLGKEGRAWWEERNKAAAIGTFVHDIIEKELKREPPPKDYPEEFTEKDCAGVDQAYSAFKKWLDDNKAETLATEISSISDIYDYAGTYDWRGMLNGKHTLVDWKSSNRFYLDHLIQMVAYLHLHDEHHPDKPVEQIVVLRLDKATGEYEDHTFAVEDMGEVWDLFLHLLEVDKLDRKLARLVPKPPRKKKD